MAVQLMATSLFAIAIAMLGWCSMLMEKHVVNIYYHIDMHFKGTCILRQQVFGQIYFRSSFQENILQSSCSNQSPSLVWGVHWLWNFLVPECEQEVTVIYNGPIEIQPDIVGVYIKVIKIKNKLKYSENWLFLIKFSDWSSRTKSGCL